MTLKLLRQQYRLTQSALGAACNTSRDRIALWENGQQKPGLGYQVKLAQAFKIPLQQLQTICNWPLTPDVMIVGLHALTGGK